MAVHDPVRDDVEALGVFEARPGELEAHAVGLRADGEFALQERPDRFRREVIVLRPHHHADRATLLRWIDGKLHRLAILRFGPAGKAVPRLQRRSLQPAEPGAKVEGQAPQFRLDGEASGHREVREGAGPRMPHLKGLPLLENHRGLRVYRCPIDAQGASCPDEREVKIAALADEGAAEIHEFDSRCLGGIADESVGHRQRAAIHGTGGRDAKALVAEASTILQAGHRTAGFHHEIRHGCTSSATGSPASAAFSIASQREASTGSKTISSPAANRKTGSRPGA
jgi:hypothetical protein